jgi:ParB family transcriptional regulator, chromosome partitioning protein
VNGKGFYLFRTLQGIIEEVDIRKVRSSSFGYRNPHNCQQQQQDGALLALRDSIQEKGLLQPITVRVKDGFYEIVIGNRRYEACKLLGLRRILCNIVELEDRQAFETSLIENMQRKDLSPLEEARAFREYVNRYGRGSISDLARRIGRSIAYVDKRTRLLDLPAEIIDMISGTDISISAAEELLTLQRQEEQCKVARIAFDNKLSLREVREQVSNSVEKLTAHFNDREDLTVYHQKDRWQFETRITELDREAQKAYDKAIVAIRMAMNKITSIMENMEENWIIYEMLRQHKEALHNHIDVLIREKQRI